MRPHRLSTALLASFLFTIFALQWWQLASYPPWLWMLLSFFFLLSILSLLEEGLRPLAAYTLCVTLGITLALSTIARTAHLQTPCTVESYADGRTVILQGFVAEVPVHSPLSTKYTIEAEWFRSAEQKGRIFVHGKILVTHYEGWPQFEYGDTVTIRGKLEKPTPFDDFAYDKYLSLQNIYSVINRATIKKTSGTIQSNHLLKPLSSLKHRFEEQMQKIFPEPHASLLSGLLTGSRHGLPQHLKDDLRTTGLSHITAVSGYNVTIVIVLITGLLFFLPPFLRLLPAVLGIVAFTLFVGADPPVVRASIMGILGLIALSFGRAKSTRFLILWTLFFMLLWNPRQLWYDMGFQLSFFAVVGISEFAPFMKPWAKKLPDIPGVREALQMTLAAQLFTFPWIALHFDTLSLISPFANVAVALFVPLSMLFGFLGVSVSFVWFLGGQLLSYLAWGCLEVIIQVAQILTRVPLASIHVPWFTEAFAFSSYLALFLLLAHLRRKHPWDRDPLTTGTPSPSSLPSPRESSPPASQISRET